MRIFEETYRDIIKKCNAQDVIGALEDINKEWDMVEPPKAKSGLTYGVIEDCLRVCEWFELDTLANDIAQLCYVNNLLKIRNMGIEEFIMAKVAYKRQNFECAKQLFLIANKLSQGVKLRAACYKEYRDLIFGHIEIVEENSLRGRVKYYINEVITNETNRESAFKQFEAILIKWEKLSEPKIFKSKAYDLIKQFICLCIEYKLYDLGNECIGLLLTRVTKCEDNGEREYIAGKLAFEQGNLAVAQQLFWISNYKSKGNIFQADKDRIYIELIEGKELKLDFNKEKYGLNKERKIIDKPKKESIVQDEEELDELPPELYKQIVQLYDEGDELSGIDAINKFEAAIKLLPGNIEDWEISKLLYAAIGDEYIAQNNFDEAFNYFTYGYNCEGMDSPYILFNLGLCLYELGDLEQATEYFMRTYMLDGERLFEDYDYDEKYFDLIKPFI